MSLETLLEAARYVEQQEIRAKLHKSGPPPGVNIIAVARDQIPPPDVVKPKLKTPPGQPVKEIVLAVTTPPVLEIVAKPLPLLNGLVEKAPIVIPTTNTSVVSQSDVAAKHFTIAAPAQPPLNTAPGVVSSKRHVTLNAQNLVSASNGILNGSVMRSGTREVHNKLEKNRRAHLKECFEMLKKQLPPQQDEKKSSNLSILHSAIRYIQVLKKRERENEHEMERLAREKIAAQQRLASLKKELGSQWDNIEFNCLIPENGQQTINSSNTPTLLVKEEPLALSTSTAQLSVLPLHTSSVSSTGVTAYHSVPLAQNLAVVGLHKLALVGSKAVQLQSPVTHIITAQPQLNGKVVPLVNAQYLMKPVVVVSTPSAGSTTISPRQS